MFLYVVNVKKGSVGVENKNVPDYCSDSDGNGAIRNGGKR